jgi:hypothetical protein
MFRFPSTALPWHIATAEQPRPAVLPPRHDVVRTSAGLGLPAVERLRKEGEPVGPVLYCSAHGVLLIPVEAGTAGTWGAPHSSCFSQGQGQWRCVDPEQSSSLVRCARLWFLPSHDSCGYSPVTAHAALHDGLSRSRSPKAAAALRSVAGDRPREVTCV